MGDVDIKRVYDAPAPSDGVRILVDRLWPRGLTHERVNAQAWDKEVAPSPGLRTWFGHDPAKFAEFAGRYRAELATNPAFDNLLDLVATNPHTTLLYAAKDPAINHAIVLRDVLRETLARATTETAEQ